MSHYEVPTSSDRIIWDIWMSAYALPTVTIADELGIFSAVAERPATIDELASRLGTDRRALAAVLRVLASVGLLTVHLGRFHAADPVRCFLLPESPAYWGPILLAHRGNQTHGWLKDMLTSSKFAAQPDAVGGIGEGERPADAWASGELEPTLARSIAAYMHAHSLPASIGAARNLDLAGVARLLDVGGGSGVFAIAFAERHPDLRCTVMELPAMCDAAHSYIDAAGAGPRVDTVAVDMFRAPWPQGYDAMFFSNIFHDWDLATAEFLARRAFEALPERGRILVHEMLLDDDGAGPATTAGFSMHMLLTKGQQYTFGELRSLLEKAGFAGIEARHSYSYYSIVTGYKDPRADR